MQVLKLTIFYLLISIFSFSIMVTDTLSRGKYYQLKFKLSADTQKSRYIGLYTQKALDADLFIYDENNNLLLKVVGSSGKYPTQFEFPGNGIYNAKIIAYSGEGPFLMLISDREELKKILKDIK